MQKCKIDKLENIKVNKLKGEEYIKYNNKMLNRRKDDKLRESLINWQITKQCATRFYYALFCSNIIMIRSILHNSLCNDDNDLRRNLHVFFLKIILHFFLIQYNVPYRI